MVPFLKQPAIPSSTSALQCAFAYEHLTHLVVDAVLASGFYVAPDDCRVPPAIARDLLVIHAGLWSRQAPGAAAQEAVSHMHSTKKPQPSAIW
eukprot:1160750-Pelagomonas_calceolata.AAC.6